MGGTESVSMGFIIMLMIGVISFLTSLVLLFVGIVVRGISNSTSHSHQRIDDLIHDNNKEHAEIRNLCLKV